MPETVQTLTADRARLREYVVFRLEGINDQLTNSVRWVRSRLDTVERHIDDTRPHSLNSLGELQSLGPEVDRLIGQRHELLAILELIDGRR